MIVLDASVLIAHLDLDNVHHDRAADLMTANIDTDFGVNTMTLAEVLVVPAREGRVDFVLHEFAALGVRELVFPPGTAVRLATIRSRTKLKMPDCCVVLAAEDHAAALASFDDRLRAAATARNIDVVDA